MKLRQILIVTFAVLGLTGLILGISLLTKRGEKENTEPTMTENFAIETSDNVKIAGTYFKVSETPEKGVILLHMRGKNRHDWDEFGQKLQQAGYDTVSIDFRGHGDSEGNWEQFETEDWQKLTVDIGVAVEYLREKNPNINLVLIGASIGANSALNYAAKNPDEIKAVVLLSPGLDYSGVKTGEVAGKFKGAALLVSSKDDPQSFDGIFTLHEALKGNKRNIIFEDAGHGTDMFVKHPELSDGILDFLKETL